MLIGEIEIDVAVMLGDADVDRALGAIELRPRLEQIERRVHAAALGASPVAS